MQRLIGGVGWFIVLLGAVRLLGGGLDGVVAGPLMAASGLLLTATGRRLLGVRREDAMGLVLLLVVGWAAVNVITTV